MSLFGCGFSMSARFHSLIALRVNLIFFITLWSILSYSSGSELQSNVSKESESKKSSQLDATERKLYSSFGLVMVTGVSNGSIDSYCLVHYNGLSIPNRPEDAISLDLFYKDSFCDSKHLSVPTQDSYVLVNYNNSCSLQTQILNIYNTGAVKGVIFSYPNYLNVNSFQIVPKTLKDRSFTIAFISEDSSRDILKNWGNHSKALIYAERSKGVFSPGLCLIFFMSIVWVCISAHYSGAYQFITIARQVLLRARDQIVAETGGEAAIENTERKKRNYESGYIKFNELSAAIFVLGVCVSLLMMHFFRQYILFSMVILFTFFSIIACRHFLLGSLSRCFKFKGRTYPMIFNLAVTVVASLPPIIWFLMRKEENAFHLHFVLTSTVLIYIVPMIRLQSYRALMILSVLIVIYDVFFVFVTPLFTSDGTSIMESVVFGGSRPGYSFGPKEPAESLPFFVKAPNYFEKDNITEKCHGVSQPVGLGYGDIIFPAIIASHCHAFDLIRRTPCRMYYVVDCIAFTIGLIITYVAVFLMQISQPALLYIVPCITLPPIVIAYFRNELKFLWNGFDEEVICQFEKYNLNLQEIASVQQELSPVEPALESNPQENIN